MQIIHEISMTNVLDPVTYPFENISTIPRCLSPDLDLT